MSFQEQSNEGFKPTRDFRYENLTPCESARQAGIRGGRTPRDVLEANGRHFARNVIRCPHSSEGVNESIQKNTELHDSVQKNTESYDSVYKNTESHDSVQGNTEPQDSVQKEYRITRFSSKE